jgi:uncharacterized protein (DUF1800 family)
MSRSPAPIAAAAILCVNVLAAAAGAEPRPAVAAEQQSLPWAAAGLTERQAAAHLLDRFAFGPRPGQIDRLVQQGLEGWLEGQLTGAVDDTAFAARVAALDAWRMTPSEILRVFPPYPVVRREAMRAGTVDRSMASPDGGAQPDRGSQADRRRAIRELYEERGYRSQRELFDQLTAFKLLQASHSEKQLEAVLADFWFNHFNVSLTDNQARSYLLSYQRDAIAPGVLGRFEDMLAEVAAHPAMLLYLDNAQSTANPGTATAGAQRMARPSRSPMGPGPRAMNAARPQQQRTRPRGLNENFARELLELHTLGVDGGYTQEDVIEVARAFTGWTVVPPGADRMQPGAARARRGAPAGAPGEFVFRADAHDAEPKTVLGHQLGRGRGIEDGLDVLDLAARHPSTARHLARKIAARFVADEPPPALVDRLAETYRSTDGDLRAVMRALAYSPEFWSSAARGQKIKSPFELAVSAVRALDGEVAAPAKTADRGPRGGARRAAGPPDLAAWIGRMGQPLYAYQAPTGYPDRAEAWVSTGALLTRMNFGLHLATGRVVGVRHDLAALGADREPESLEQALSTYAALLLPERDLTETVRRLEPMVRDPGLGGKVEQAAQDMAPAVASTMVDAEGTEPEERSADVASAAASAAPLGAAGADPLAHVVGVILGSPEFQRR